MNGVFIAVDENKDLEGAWKELGESARLEMPQMGQCCWLIVRT